MSDYVCSGQRSGQLAPVYLRAVAASDIDVDHERSGVGLAGPDVPGLLPVVDELSVGRVGPGSVLGLLHGEPDDPDALLSYFGPGATRMHRVFSHAKLFACPLFVSERRKTDDHVFDFWIPTSMPAQHWILRGVHALL